MARLQHSKRRSNIVKFHLILVYLGRYTIKFLLTEISVYMGNICSDDQRSIHSEQVFLRMDLLLS